MKTTSIKLIMTGTVIILFGWLSMSFVNYQDAKKKKWDVPEASKKTKNPVKSDSESLANGKTLYSLHCKSCHGNLGKGDGTKAKKLDTPCGDFTTKEFQAQTDGEIFYKVNAGRDDMPTFKKKISDPEDVWSVINYVRTLGESK